MYADGRALTYDESTLEYAVGGTGVSFAQVLEYDQAGQISWASSQLRDWARSQRMPPEPGGEPAMRAASGLRWWQVLVGLVFLPFTLLYLVWMMWQRKMFSVNGRVVLTAVSACMFLGMLGVAFTPQPDSAAPMASVAGSVSAPATTSTPATAPAAAEFEPPRAAVMDVAVVSVSRVVDGDTIVVAFPDGRTEKVRLIGVDCPESTTKVEEYGAEASNYTRNSLPTGKTVYLETDVETRDRYGRLLAYLWLTAPSETPTPLEIRQHLFNANLLDAGYAQLMTIPPNVKYVETYTIIQNEARTAEAGLWAPQPEPEPEPEAAAEPAPAPAKPSSKSTTVYVTKTGSKYHVSGCGYLSKSKIAISLKDAKASGCTPCSRCDPPN